MDLERTPTSALIKRLRDAARARPRSLGFGRERAGAPPPPPMLLVAEVAGLDGAAASAAVAAGAAAVAFTIDAATAASIDNDLAAVAAAARAIVDAIPGLAFAADAAIPAGLPDRLAGVGIDFVVASVQRAPASLLNVESIARVPLIDASQPAGMLRALGEMKIDAVVVGPPRRRRAAADLTVFDLMHYRQVAEFVRQPVLLRAEQTIQADDLQAIRDLGIEGIVLPLASLADAAATLTAFRDAIGKIKITRHPERADGGVFLPRPSVATAVAADDGDGDDDEE